MGAANADAAWLEHITAEGLCPQCATKSSTMDLHAERTAICNTCRRRRPLWYYQKEQRWKEKWNATHTKKAQARKSRGR